MALKDTLNSLQGQSSNNFEAIVVGHDKPEFMDSAACKIPFSAIDIPPPDPQSNNFHYLECEVDKNTKITSALQSMRNSGHSYWYYLDADDLLHRSFVSTILSQELQAGCVLNGGYEVYKSKGRIVPVSNLSELCGSTSILSDGIFDIPLKLDRESIKAIPWCKYPHFSMHNFFDSISNCNHLTIQQRLIAYSRNYGDNLSDVEYPKNFSGTVKSWLKPYLKGKLVNAEMRRNFSLDASWD